MKDSIDDRQLFETCGKWNFLFFLERNYCALVYLYFTDHVDLAGRRIYSLEGICCKKSESRLFWRVLPFAIRALYGKGISNTWKSGEDEIWIENKGRTEIPGIESYLKRSLSTLMDECKEMDYSFLNLLEEIYLTDCMYPFFVWKSHYGLPCRWRDTYLSAWGR